MPLSLPKTRAYVEGKALILLFPAYCLAQWEDEVPRQADPKALEVALSFSQTLTGWAILIIGGSVLILVGSSYYRPKVPWMRWAYLTFIPAWIFLSVSMYKGVRVHGAYVAYLVARRPNFFNTRDTMNDYAYCQTWTMEFGLAIFGLWLLAYLIWWIFLKERESSDAV